MGRLKCLFGSHDWHRVWWNYASENVAIKPHNDRECYRCGKVEFRD